MSKKEKVSVTELFSRLELYQSKNEHEGIFDSSNRILNQNPSDETALKAFAVSGINLDKYQQVYDVLAKTDKLRLEFAFTLYKLGKHDELKNIMEKYGSTSRGIQHVWAQSLYKVENFSEALKVYRSLIENKALVSNEEFDLSVNERAVLAQLGIDSKPVSTEFADSYDQLYNAAIWSIKRGELEEAIQTLKLAKIKCQTAGTEDYESDLAQIMIQAAYATYLNGSEEEASNILQSIDVKQLDPVLRYIFNTNKLILNPPENPNLALRYIEQGSSFAKILPKLVFSQIRTISNNRFLIELKTGKGYKNLVKTSLPVSKSLECKTVTQDIKQLVKEFQKSPMDALIAFTLAQLYTNSGEYSLATAVFTTHVKSIDAATAYSPGYVAAITSLLKVSRRYTDAVEYFERAIQHWSSFDSNDNVTELIQEAAFALAGFDTDKAQLTSFLENEYSKSKGNGRIELALIAAGDSRPELQSFVKPVSELVGDINVESISSQGILPLLRKPGSQGISYKVTKKTGGKKKRLPKNYVEGTVADPERWLPKRDRSTWKPKRKEKKKVTQGGAVNDDLDVNEGKTTSSVNASTVKKSKQGNNNKKKKKGRK